MKKAGYIILQIAAYFVLLGGIADFVMTFANHSLPASHLSYLHIRNSDVSPEFKNLDHAFIRAIGGCLIAIGIGALTIIYGPVRKGVRWPLLGLLTMVSFGEGGNTIQMLSVDSPYFIFPLTCLILIWTGAMFWWFGNKEGGR